MFRLFARIAYTVIILIQALIVFRIAIVFFGLPTGNQMISFVMQNSAYFINPFSGILSNDLKIFDTFRLELTSVVALFFYMISGVVITEIIKAFSVD